LPKQNIKCVDGFVTVPEEPGLGIELNKEIANKYRVDSSFTGNGYFILKAELRKLVSRLKKRGGKQIIKQS